jgi:hypothetical protein
LAEGKLDVVINDDRGRRISGTELAHCRIGTRKLNADLTTR